MDDLFTNPRRWADLESWRRAAVALHAQGPIHRVESEHFGPFWAVITRDAIFDVERRPQLFTNAPEPVLASRKAIAARPFALRTLVHMDAPDHPKHRKLAQDWFRGPSLEAMQGRLEALSAKAVTRLRAADGGCDFVQAVALRYPLEAILAILGLPEQDYELMLRLTQEMFGQEDPDLRRKGETRQVFGSAAKDIFQYFSQVAADRRARPTDDLASAIANGTVDGAPLSEMDMLSYYLIIATAGHDTTAYAMAGGMLALATHPAQFQQLRREPERLGAAVEEMFRWTTPARHFMRTAAEDTEIAGQAVRAGDWIYLSYPAANLDPAVFEEPLRFDITRANADRHATFGHGVHFCLGTQMARMEMRSLFGALVANLETLELGGEVAYSQTTTVGGVKRLPIRYLLSRAAAETGARS